MRPASDVVVGTMKGPRLESQRQDAPAVSNPSIFDNTCLECQLQTFLGPQPTKDDLHCVAYFLGNVATQLSGGSPLPPDVLFDRATTTFPFGMGNVAQHLQHHTAPHVIDHFGGGGLVGVTEFANDSDDDLLADDSLLGSDTGSCTGSHHPLLECFATGTPEGYVEEAEDLPRCSCDRTPTPALRQRRGAAAPCSHLLSLRRDKETGSRRGSCGRVSSPVRKSWKKLRLHWSKNTRRLSGRSGGATTGGALASMQARSTTR